MKLVLGADFPSVPPKGHHPHLQALSTAKPMLAAVLHTSLDSAPEFSISFIHTAEKPLTHAQVGSSQKYSIQMSPRRERSV